MAVRGLFLLQFVAVDLYCNVKRSGVGSGQWGLGSRERDRLRPLCWAQHMSLDNGTGLDPPGTGLAAA
ncbi:hypothetical protein V6N11_049465 [Hibiscus sabdariffa]|uniref:Secreted protein n=2 Tax=Hibiscus sabdariffa TaxID=183260 RepID=A0ABR2BQ01_9ROSI